MSKRDSARSLFIAILCLTTTVAPDTKAQSVPPDIHFQGQLRDPSGSPLAGPVSLRVDLFNAPAGGDLLYGEDHANVALNDGVFAVLLGAGTNPTTPEGLPAVFEATSEVYLQLTVDDGTGAEVLAPRQPFSSVAYALVAGDADTLDGIDSEVLVRNDQVSVVPGLVVRSTIPDLQFDDTGGDDFTLGNNNGNFRIRNDTDLRLDLIIDGAGRMGLGRDFPQAKLDVGGSVAINGVAVIDANGQWVGDPTGLQGPQGPEGPPGPAVSTSAVCVGMGVFCSSLCDGEVVASAEIVQGCSVTSDTGSCSMPDPPDGSVTCCVCAP